MIIILQVFPSNRKQIVALITLCLSWVEIGADDSFPASQFLIQRFCTPFKVDRNKNGGRILLYVRSNIISTKINKYIIKNQIEAFLLEIRIVHIIQINCKLHPTFKKYLIEFMLVAIRMTIY